MNKNLIGGEVMKEKELQTLTQQGKEAMELLEEARFHRERMKKYALYKLPKEFIEKFMCKAVIEVIYRHEYFGKTAYYIPDIAYYESEVPVVIDHNYGSEEYEPCYTVEIFSKSSIEKDLEAFFYKELYKWIINTGDPLYGWLMDNIKKTVEVDDYLRRVEGYSLYTYASNLTEDRFREMLRWSLAFEMYNYLLRFGYYEQIKRRMNLIHHKLNLKPIIPPEKSVIIEKLGLLGDEYFEFDYWDDESRKQYLQEKLLDLVQPEHLRKGLHLLLYWYCYTDDLMSFTKRTFPEWFAES
jgi:hypothetical protein